MEGRVAKIRLAILVALFVLYLVYLDLLLRRIELADRLRRRSPEQIRKRASAFVIHHADRVYHLTRWLLKWDVEMLGPHADGFGQDGIAVVFIPNHVGNVDVPVLSHMAKSLGIDDVRWVMKEEVLRWPVVGRLARRAGCAAVARSGRKSDLDAVRRMAEEAHAERGSIVIFPEGTTFAPRKLGPNYRRCLEPKLGGLIVAREKAPDHHVVAIAQRWDIVNEDLQPFAALHKTYGRRLELIVERPPLMLVWDNDVKDWFPVVWKRMDRTLIEGVQRFKRPDDDDLIECDL